MSLQFIAGSPGSGKSYELYQEIIQKSAKDPDTSYFILVPEQFTLQTQKTLVSLHPKKGIMNIDILSFVRLAYRIFDETGWKEQPVLDDMGKSLVLRRLVAGQKKKLGVLGRNVRKQGFVAEIKSLLSEFYQYNLSPESLEGLLGQLGDRRLLEGKLSDMLMIYREFQQYLQGRFITAEGLMEELCRRIGQSELLRDSVVCLDGYTGFTPSQYKVLEQLLKVCRKVIITVILDPREEMDQVGEEHQLFYLSRKTIRACRNLAEQNAVAEDRPRRAGEGKIPYRFRESRALAALEQNLFRFPWQPFREKQGDIRILCCKNPREEMACITEQIQEMAREQGFRYGEMAVVTGDLAQYARLAQQSLERAGIPCFVDQKADIFASPLVEYLLGALETVEKDFSYEGVFRFLRSGLTALTREETDLLENAVLAEGIRGIRQWKREWDWIRNAQEIRPVKDKFLAEVLPPLERLKDASTVTEITLCLYEMMQEQEIAGRMGEADSGDREDIPLAAREADHIYGSIIELFDQMTGLLGEEKTSLKEYAQILEEGIGEIKLGQIPSAADQIVVGDLKRTRLKDIKVLFLIGVNDGVTPAPSSRGGLLTDRERELLAELGAELAPTRRQETYQDQFYLYMNLTRPSRRLILTYSKSGADGKGLRPSALIHKICQIFPGLTAEQDEERKEEYGYLLREDEGRQCLIDGMRLYRPDSPETDPFWRELFRWYGQNRERGTTDRLIDGVCYQNGACLLSEEEAQGLYGTKLVNSVTRLQTYASCPFAYYVSAGLRLKERKFYSIEAMDLGNLLHHAVEQFGSRLKEEGTGWDQIDPDSRDRLAADCLREAAEEYENRLFLKDNRSSFLVKRLEKTFQRNIWALCEQVRQGSFRPVEYELEFHRIREMTFDLGEGRTMTLQGKIDRIDRMEKEDKAYIKIIDYKTGQTGFDWPALYYGLQMQLLVYLKGAMAHQSRQLPGKEIRPGGVFYYPIRDPYIETASEEGLQQLLFREMGMDGLVCDDPEILEGMDRELASGGQRIPSVKSAVIPVETGKDGNCTRKSGVISGAGMDLLLDQTARTMQAFGKEILEGHAEIAPYQYGSQTGCDYCAYRPVCGFDTRLPGNDYRKLSRMDREEVLNRMAEDRKKGEQEGDGAHEQGEMDSRTAESH